MMKIDFVNEEYDLEGVEFDISKVEFRLTKEAHDIIDYFGNNVMYICDHIDDYEDWIMELIYKMLHGFEHLEFRNCPVNFRFTHNRDEKTKVTTFRVFVLNVILWLPQVKVDFDNIGDDLVIPVEDSPKVVPDYIADYMTNHYTIPYVDTGRIDVRFLSECMADSIWHLQMWCHIMENFLGLTISTEVFIQIAKRVPEFNELMHVRLDETKQPSEIEEDARRISKQQWNNILNDPEFNVLKPLVATKALKERQLAEFDSVIPLKPDVEGNTIPFPINRNWLTGELNTIMATFINDISGRKSAILNNEFMGKAGHILILTAILCMDVKLSTKIKDCHSPNPVPIKIKSKKHLDKLNGRYYRFSGQTDSDYKMLDNRMDEGLIGETVWFRSPITCCSEDGRVCAKCYGRLAKLNSQLHSVGAFAAFAVLMEVMQKLLSAKHHQETKSMIIKFLMEIFHELFTLSGTDVVINIDNDELEEYTLILKREDVKFADTEDTISVSGNKRGKKKAVENDEDEETGDSSDTDSFRLDYYTTKFYVTKEFSPKKKMEVEELYEEKQKELYLHKDFINRMKFMNHPHMGEIFYIGLDEIDPSEFIFMLETENFELSKPLNSIKKLIDTKNHEGCDSYEEMAQLMLDLIIQAGNSASSLQGEIIIRQLIRDDKLVMKRPDFSHYIDRRDYQIMSVNTALKKHPSITTSLSTPYLRYQFLSQLETFEKCTPSDLDKLFKETLVELGCEVIKDY